MKVKKSRYDFYREIEELIDDALDSLSPENFDKLKDDIHMLLDDYEE